MVRKKILKTQVGKNVKKRELEGTAAGNVNWHIHNGKPHSCHMMQQFYSRVFTQRRQKQELENTYAPRGSSQHYLQ